MQSELRWPQSGLVREHVLFPLFDMRNKLLVISRKPSDMGNEVFPFFSCPSKGGDAEPGKWEEPDAKEKEGSC